MSNPGNFKPRFGNLCFNGFWSYLPNSGLVKRGGIKVADRIKDLKPGECAEIIGYEGTDPAYRSKLLAMGLTKGIEIKLIKVAPLGDPVEVMVRGYNLSLRKTEADILQVRRKR
jgi:ferrous iron transport protein A